MIEDLLVDPEPGPFDSERWDLSGVAFSDDPLAVVHERVSMYLLARGYRDVSEPGVRRWHRGAAGLVEGPRGVCEICEDVMVEAIRPGVYRVDMAFVMPDSLASGPEREFRRAELAALEAVVEGRPAHVVPGLETAADAILAKRDNMTPQVVLAVGVFVVIGALSLAMNNGTMMLFPVAWLILRGILHARSEAKAQTEADDYCLDRAPRSADRDRRVVERAISAIGYWRAWSNDVAGRFDVYFSHAQVWSPRRADGYRPPGPLGLRFHEPRFVAFTTLKGDDALPLPARFENWPQALATGKLPGLAMSEDGVRFDSRPAVEKAILGAHWMSLVGEALPPRQPGECSLVLRAGPYGLVVVAARMSLHTVVGEVTKQGAATLHERWFHDWLEYWGARVRDEAVEYDVMCDLYVPLHPDLQEPGIMALALLGPPGL